MTRPWWLADALAAVVIAVALFSAVRLVAARGRRWQGELDADLIHVLMGVAMAGMFVPGLSILPVAVWETVFAAGGLWFGWRVGQARRGSRAGHSGLARNRGLARYGGLARYWGLVSCYCRYPVPHLVDCVAMMYMLWAVAGLRSVSAPASGGAMAGAMSGVRLPVLGLGLALCICAYVVWLADRAPLLASVPAPAGGPPAASSAGPGSAVGSPLAAGSAARSSFAGGSLTAGSTAGSSLAGGSAPAPVAGRALLAPRTATCCKIAMGVAMGVMLVDLL
jgi:Domain of unknown function (DUF5134)